MSCINNTSILIKPHHKPHTLPMRREVIVQSFGIEQHFHSVEADTTAVGVLLCGVIDSNEKAQEAFRRECEEELGCVVDIIKELGIAIEYKSQENFKQLSFVYKARKVDELESNNLTEKEKAEGTEYVWLPKLQAPRKMKESLEKLGSSDYDSVYRTRFMVLRDVRILDHYINNV